MSGKSEVAGAGGERFDRGSREAAAEEHFQRYLWTRLLLPLAGIWQLASPATFGYGGSAMAWSDFASGALLVVLGLLSLTPRRLWAPWAAFAVGVWLEFAPILLWAPAAAYLNSSLVGIAVVALTVLIPDVPGAVRFREPGPDRPPGWSYNPSSWVQRMPLLVLAVGGWFLSRYLAAFHLGFIDTVWDPFFGDGTREVLLSDVSEAFPVSDAGLGAVAYTFEALFVFLGARDRWRTNPSTVIVFCLLVVPLGVTHLVLVTLMPVLVGHWCTFCLLTAILMLLMVPLAVDEIVATGMFVRRKMAQGHTFRGIVAKGGGLPEKTEDAPDPKPNVALPVLWPAMVRGVSLPWMLVLSTGLGAWLFFAPAVLGTGGGAANNVYLTAALVVTVSVVALAEVARIVRFANVPLGLWVALAAWVFPDVALPEKMAYTVTGLLLAVLALPRGPVHERYGDWERWIR
ncbi:MAG: vitamin K epoxide reductase family protein [Verrucomicrobiales bacterium]